MNLIKALSTQLKSESVLTRPRLLSERGAYVTYEGPAIPMKMRWLDRPTLSIDWTPAPHDLLADDWLVVTKEWMHEVRSID